MQATSLFSLMLSIFGLCGTATLIICAGIVFWHHRQSRYGSFRWHWRNWRLMQLSAIATLFFLAMTASYSLLGEYWLWVYLLLACKTSTWWFRYALSRRA